MYQGDRIFIREGVYYETLILKNIGSQNSKNNLITNYQNEKVVLKGTKRITKVWRKYHDNIYTAKLDFPITQLFINEKSLSFARWPNGDGEDKSIWNKKTSFAWPQKKSIFGEYYHQRLKEFNFSLKDAIIIVNSGSFRTYESKITEHIKGSDHFVFNTKGVKVHFSCKNKAYKHAFFLEGKLGFLDSENEWYYDYKKSQAYIYKKRPQYNEARRQNKVLFLNNQKL